VDPVFALNDRDEVRDGNEYPKPEYPTGITR
jgi:hypothetical protein